MTRYINPVSPEISAIRSKLTSLEFQFEYDGKTPPDANEVSSLITSITAYIESLERKCCDELSTYSQATVDLSQL